MYKIFQIEILVLLTIINNVLSENKTKDIQEEALEKEKSELFKQINEAIDESVKLLRKNNDSEAVLGVNYMQQLKEELQVINGTDFTDIEPQNVNETRRSKKLKLSMFDLAKVFQKDKDIKTTKERAKNRILIQKKIDEWLMQRELEKRKIREYKQKRKMYLKEEKCPRHGLGSKEKKTRRSNTGRKNKKHTVKKTQRKYPCCRKCCKKSYLGCL